MLILSAIAKLLLGSSPRLRTVLTYWAATAFIYCLSAVIVVHEALLRGDGQLQAGLVASFGVGGAATFYVLLRCAERLSIAHWKLALAQAYYAVLYNVSLYVALGPLGGSFLIGLPVILVFCALALRPGQTIGLSVFAAGAQLLASIGLLLLQPQTHRLDIELINVFLTSFGVAAVALINRELSRLRARLVEAVATIRQLATTDELTLLANRRHMHELLAVEQQRRRARPGPVCVALLDIDFFKVINDRYGHAAGDTVLRSFAAAASASMRGGDTLARWGGEEFLLLMPDTSLADAEGALERIRAAAAALRFDAIDASLRLSFSAGVAAAKLPEARFDEAIGRADAAMYQAKSNGRDQVVTG